MPEIDPADIERIVRSVVGEVVGKVAGETVAANASGEVDLKPDTTTHEVPLNRRDDVKRVALGAGHAALEAKDVLKTYLESLGYRVVDVGTNSAGEVDYPEFAAAVAKKVASGECERGIMLDTDGVGSAIVCNKIKGVRAALCYDMRTVINSREHVNANVMALGGPLHGKAELCEMAKVWLESRFPGGKRWPEVNGIMAFERP